MTGWRSLPRAARLLSLFLLVGGLPACMTVAEKPAVEATGAPVGAGIDVPPGTNEDFIVNVGRRIYFKEGSAELDDTAKATLDKQAEWLSRYGRYKVRLAGFADDKGNDAYNAALGTRRAEAVRAYFLAQGINPARMRVRSYGNSKERLVNDCDDASCRAQNRRVVTVLEGGAGV
jgi:peptidoglycan-associated lipoprotein